MIPPKPPWSAIGKKLESLCRKALYDFSMYKKIKKRLAIALSGGKDSATMLSLLAAIRGRGVPPVSLEAIHITDPLSISAQTTDVVKEVCKLLDISLTIRSFPDVSRENFDCYKCSRLRRKVLFQTAKELKASHIAFAHHREDNVQTLLLNLLHKGEFAAMLPTLFMVDYDITIIRPMIYISEKDIIHFAQYHHFSTPSCCSRSKVSKRSAIEKLLCTIEKEFPHVRNNLSLSAFKYGSKKAIKQNSCCNYPKEAL